MISTKYNREYSFFYVATHLTFGVILSLNKIKIVYRLLLLSLIAIYQLGQLAINKRYFFLTNSFKRGNSIGHTFNKFLHHFLGYIIGKTFLNQKILANSTRVK